MVLSPDSSGWYARHWIRDNAIKELIGDSRYADRMLVSGSICGIKIGAGVVGGIVTGALVFTGGAGIAYLGALADSVEAIGCGIVVAIYGPIYGAQIITEVTVDSVEDLKHDLDSSARYRFVRFLPEYIWAGWSDEDILYPLVFKTKKATSASIRPVVKGRTRVSIMHMPDMAPLPSQIQIQSATPIPTKPLLQTGPTSTIDEWRKLRN